MTSVPVPVPTVTAAIITLNEERRLPALLARLNWVSEIVVTNTLPIRPEQAFDKLTVLSIAPLLGKAIREVFEDGSVTSLFAGRS